ncbi:Ribokinase [Halomicronema hongdechloris C2206]|uniref:Ribokinase n=2 Tax=Halomicronema hongdechloris TaxID=1209493 RepID=A0A1Z3HPJ1_9CYAN|nr:Ribokinase [Halomicronema hongdechloris C2206]
MGKHHLPAQPVTCIGECLIDRLMAPDSLTGTDYPGGAPANVACALVKLGRAARFLGCIGQDVAGDTLIQRLQAIGVDCQGVQRSKAPTRQVIVKRNAMGERWFAGFSHSDPSGFADARLSSDWLQLHWSQATAGLVMGTLALAYPQSRAAMAQAATLAQQHDVPIIIDINWRPMFWPNPAIALEIIHDFLKQATLLKWSQDDAQELLGTADPEVIARQFPQAKAVLVTAGAAGCTYVAWGQRGYQPAFAVPSQDTTGAGDAFLAAFLCQLLERGWDSLKQPQQVAAIVAYASAAGALATCQAGAIAAQPTAAEIAALLKASSPLQ